MPRSRHLLALVPAPRSYTQSKVSLAGFIVACATLAACADSTTNRTLTAPDARREISETSADFGVAFTLDGPLSFADENGTAQLAAAQLGGAQLAASPQAAGGGRASGHVGFPT